MKERIHTPTSWELQFKGDQRAVVLHNNEQVVSLALNADETWRVDADPKAASAIGLNHQSIEIAFAAVIDADAAVIDAMKHRWRPRNVDVGVPSAGSEHGWSR